MYKMVKFLNKIKRNKKETPNEIFKKLKDSKKEVSEESLNEYYKNASLIAESFIQTRQIDSLEKLTYLMSCVEKEKEVLKYGINQYIFRDDIEDFLERRDIQASNIKLIELEDYPRIIPNDIRKKIEKTKNIFDKMYVLFTDYSGVVAKEHMRDNKIKGKDKDPILFGTFQRIDRSQDAFARVTSRVMNDKFYVIGDWVDEYCDLTLDKLVAMTSNDIVKEITVPRTLEEINKTLSNMKKGEENV